MLFYSLCLHERPRAFNKYKHFGRKRQAFEYTVPAREGAQQPSAPPPPLRAAASASPRRLPASSGTRTPEGAPAEREPSVPLPRDISHSPAGRPSARREVSISPARDIPQSVSARRRVQRGLAEPVTGLSAGCFEGLRGSFGQIGSARPEALRGAALAKSKERCRTYPEEG